MDQLFETILEQALFMLKNTWWLFAIAFAFMVLMRYTAQLRGAVGEWRVKRTLCALAKEEYTLLNDVLLETDSGTTQIDHVLVSIYGIFVIETKNYTGAVYGKAREKRWTVAHGKNKRSFLNPIHQNYGHVKAIERALGGEVRIKPIPIVVFSDGCKLNLTTEGDAVMHLSELIAEVRKHTAKLLSPEEAQRAVAILTECNISGRAARRAHVKRVGALKA